MKLTRIFKLLLPFVTLLLFINASAQIDEVIFKNLKDVDTKRYAGIKGNCYLFKSFTEAKLYDLYGVQYDGIKINFNGEDKYMEVQKNEKQYITAVPSTIPRIVIDDMSTVDRKELQFLDSLVFIHGSKLKSQSSYHILLCNKENRMLFLDFYVAMNAVTDQLPGQTVERKTFNRSYRLILINEKGEKTFKMNKKDIINALSIYGDFGKWCKKNKMKVNSIEAVTTFINET